MFTVPGYVGCFYEIYEPNRHLLPDHPIINGQPSFIDGSDMSIKKCIEICRQLEGNMRYAGLEGERECYCGTEDHSNSFILASRPDVSCSSTCAGNPLDVCGGEFLISIYDSMYY